MVGPDANSRVESQNDRLGMDVDVDVDVVVEVEVEAAEAQEQEHGILASGSSTVRCSFAHAQWTTIVGILNSCAGEESVLAPLRACALSSAASIACLTDAIVGGSG